MKKSLLFLGLSLLTAASASAVSVQFSALNEDGVTIYYGAYYSDGSDTGTAAVTYKDTDYNSYTAADVVIPSTVVNEGITFTVTAIGNNAFNGSTSVVSVVLPETITSISYNAFYGCTSLASINLPDGLTSLGGEAFSECSSLTSIDMPDTVTEMGYSCFSNCPKLASVKLSAGLTTLELGVFMRDYALTSIVIPDGVTTIKKWAFNMCTALNSITIPDSVTSIGPSAFYFCGMYNKNENWVNDYSLFYIGSNLISSRNTEGDVVIPDGTRLIASNAFDSGSKITSVTFPASLRYICGSAFSACSGITALTLPAGVVSIQDGAFYYCSGVETVRIPSTVNFLGSNAFGGCTSLEKFYVDNVNPANITLQSASVFSNSSYETCTLYVPEGCKSLYEAVEPWSLFGDIQEDGELSAIDCLDVNTPALPADNNYYDLMGRRVANPTSGIYIQGGRKVLVK